MADKLTDDDYRRMSRELADRHASRMADSRGDSMPGARPTDAESAAHAQSRASWRRMNPHLSLDEVITLLGKPGRMSQQPDSVFLSFPFEGSVAFRNGAIESWREPKRFSSANRLGDTDQIAVSGQSWGQLVAGMSKSEVRALIGEPNRIDHALMYDDWHYTGSGLVSFCDEVVLEWKNPTQSRADSKPEPVPRDSRSEALRSQVELSGGQNTNTRSSAGAEFKVGDRFANRFTIRALIAQGGMGAVYRAGDDNTGEVVALKTIRPDLVNSPAAVERFLSEGKVTRRLAHPGIARVFDIDKADGRWFIAMEFVRGQTLREWMRSRDAKGARISVKDALWAARKILDVLAYLHTQGIIHRDLKPENIIVGKAADGSGNFLKIVDFGLARSLAGDGPQLTATGTVLGTFSYMSPEQRAGKPLDQRSDLYSAAVIVYEMLTGVAYDGNWESIVARGTDVSQSIQNVLKRALSKFPEQRFESAAALRSALDAPSDALQSSIISKQDLIDFMSGPREATQAARMDRATSACLNLLVRDHTTMARLAAPELLLSVSNKSVESEVAAAILDGYAIGRRVLGNHDKLVLKSGNGDLESTTWSLVKTCHLLNTAAIIESLKADWVDVLMGSAVWFAEKGVLSKIGSVVPKRAIRFQYHLLCLGFGLAMAEAHTLVAELEDKATIEMCRNEMFERLKGPTSVEVYLSGSPYRAVLQPDQTGAQSDAEARAKRASLFPVNALYRMKEKIVPQMAHWEQTVKKLPSDWRIHVRLHVWLRVIALCGVITFWAAVAVRNATNANVGWALLPLIAGLVIGLISLMTGKSRKRIASERAFAEGMVKEIQRTSRALDRALGGEALSDSDVVELSNWRSVCLTDDLRKGLNTDWMK